MTRTEALRRAGSAPAARLTVAETRALLARARRCLYRSRPRSCGCVRCALRGGVPVRLDDCRACLETYGDS